MQLTIMAEELSSSSTVSEASTPMKPQHQQRPRSNSDCDASVGTCSTASLSDSSSHADSSSNETTLAASLVGTTTSPPEKQKRSRRRVRGRKNNNSNNNAVGGKKKNSKKKQQQPQLLSLEEQAQYLAMDCEMVGVGPGGRYSAVARVTIVNWNGDVVLDEYCDVHQPITDFRTAVSGITAEQLASAQYTFCEMQQMVYGIIHDKILIGHALKNDLHALGLDHAWQQTRDTAKYEPFMHHNPVLNRLGPRKLKDLAEQYLHQPIQQAGMSHCPIEDARTALDLYKLKRTKWEKVMEYKIQRTAEIMQQQQQ